MTNGVPADLVPTMGRTYLAEQPWWRIACPGPGFKTWLESAERTSRNPKASACRFREKMSPGQTLILGFLLGGALIAFWLAARFPTLGPKSLGYGLLLLGAGFAAINAMPVVTIAMTKAPVFGMRFLAAFGLVLPVLTYAFLATLWVVKIIHDALSGHLR